MEKDHPLKIQLLNVFKDHHIVAQLSVIVAGSDEWPLSNVLWTIFDNSHGQNRSESNEYFYMYQCQ